ncbi:MAG TPA: histidine kinase, partial [Acidobacteriota bacterium]|nr:histidine kinase [Acidobacteriota bacterium]
MITKRLWFGVLGLATGIALAFALQVYILSILSNTPFDWKDQLVREISSWCLWAALFPIILALAQKFRFESGTRLKSALVHISAGAVIACLHGTIYMLFAEWLLHPERDWQTVQKIFAEKFFYTTLWRFLMYQIILSASLALNYYRSIKETEIQSSRLQDSILRSQIESLKMQIDPDLLFKSLNELPNLMQRDLDAADEMVARLGDYLRITLENSQNQEVTLRQEIELLKCYLAIENIRRSNSVEVQFEIEEETFECSVPSLILQAPVEDAIRRGNDDAPLRLVIVSSKTDTALLLTIADEDKSHSAAKSPRLHQLLERFNALYQTKIHVHTYGSDEKTST